MKSLNAQGWAGLVALVVVMAVLVFGPAGTLRYWQGWTFMGVYFAWSLAITLYLMKTDPALLQRRIAGGPWAEKEPAQKVIMSFASVGFLGLLLVPALDRRFGWSHMPGFIAVIGDVLMSLGWVGIIFVFRENSFSSSTIELADDQRVISTGPYGLVRHPMYAAALIMLAGIPISLGSWWGLLCMVFILPVIVWRLLDEERFLAAGLHGYAAYQTKMRYRLIPGVW